MYLESGGEEQMNTRNERKRTEELLDMISAVKCHISIYLL